MSAKEIKKYNFKNMFLKNKVVTLILILFLLFVPVVFTSAKSIVPCGHGDNPQNACTLCHLIVGIENLVSFGLGLLIVVAAVGIFIAGVMYIVSSGNEKLMSAAKNFLGASLKGFAIVLMAWFFVNITFWIMSVKDDLGIHATNWYTFTCNTQSSTAPSTHSGDGGGGGGGSW